MPKIWDTIILGAGGAGLMCAGIASQGGASTLVIDHADKPGKKILISGGGRCNFTNLHTGPENFLSANPHFAKSALSRYTQWDFIDLVTRHNIAHHEKTLGQLFCDTSAREIVAMLLAATGRNRFPAAAGLALAMANRSSLRHRIQLILDKTMKRNTLTNVQKIVLACAVISLAAPLALTGIGPTTAAAAPGDQVADLTERAMQGELDFEEALRARVELLAGQPESILDQGWDRLRLTPGARTFIATLRHLGFKIAIVSGGFTSITERLKDELQLDYAFANTLEIQDGKLTGQVEGPVVDRARKAELLHMIAAEEGLATRQIVAVGDGANDIDMLEAAGLGIAFNAKSGVASAADAQLNLPYLDAVLFLLGVSREDIESEGSLTSETPPPVG